MLDYGHGMSDLGQGCNSFGRWTLKSMYNLNCSELTDDVKEDKMRQAEL